MGRCGEVTPLHLLKSGSAPGETHSESCELGVAVARDGELLFIASDDGLPYICLKTLPTTGSLF
jgi:hypothetical protein